jgi:hypothetical protein
MAYEQVTSNVTADVIRNFGHWVAEENPAELIHRLPAFFDLHYTEGLACPFEWPGSEIGFEVGRNAGVSAGDCAVVIAARHRAAGNPRARRIGSLPSRQRSSE